MLTGYNRGNTGQNQFLPVGSLRLGPAVKRELYWFQIRKFFVSIRVLANCPLGNPNHSLGKAGSLLGRATGCPGRTGNLLGRAKHWLGRAGRLLGRTYRWLGKANCSPGKDFYSPVYYKSAMLRGIDLPTEITPGVLSFSNRNHQTTGGCYDIFIEL